MDWFFLFLAGMFEIVFGTSLKLMDNHKNILWTIVFYISMILSFVFLNFSLKTIPIGVAYAVWTGIGVAGIVVIGYFFFKEAMSPLKLFFLFSLLVSIIGLKINSAE